MQAYLFTGDSKNDYVLVNVEINQISRNTSNDSVEYYYYLSPNSEEKDITNWTKITEEQTSNSKLQFTIDTRAISNYNEIANEDVLYIYVKEVAIKGGDQSVAIAKTMQLEVDSDLDFEIFVDNAKIDLTVSDSNKTVDNTTSTGKLPQTGAKITLLVIIIMLLNIAIILYIKNKNLSKYVK
jgi:hypothetical protein